MEMEECKVENDNYYWLLTVEEIEMLLSVYKNDKTLFYKIIKEKIDREENHFINGKSIIQLLNENKIVKNDYLAQEKIKKYMDIVTNNARNFL